MLILLLLQNVNILCKKKRVHTLLLTFQKSDWQNDVLLLQISSSALKFFAKFCSFTAGVRDSWPHCIWLQLHRSCGHIHLVCSFLLNWGLASISKVKNLIPCNGNTTVQRAQRLGERKKDAVLLKLVCGSNHTPAVAPLPEADVFISRCWHRVAALQHWQRF